MMKCAPLLWLVACIVPLHAESLQPVQEGTLANQQLIRDAMVGVAGQVAALGCDAPERFVPVVLQLPKGEPGSRYWKERWEVEGCGKLYPVVMDFRETGMESAMWSIVP